MRWGLRRAMITYKYRHILGACSFTQRDPSGYDQVRRLLPPLFDELGH